MADLEFDETVVTIPAALVKEKKEEIDEWCKENGVLIFDIYKVGTKIDAEQVAVHFMNETDAAMFRLRWS